MGIPNRVGFSIIHAEDTELTNLYSTLTELWGLILKLIYSVFAFVSFLYLTVGWIVIIMFSIAYAVTEGWVWFFPALLIPNGIGIVCLVAVLVIGDYLDRNTRKDGE